MRNLNELKIKPRSPSFGGLDESQVPEFEKHFNLKLPEEHIEFLRHQNGGFPGLRYYSDPAGGNSEVNDFYGLGTFSADAQVQAKGSSSWDFGNLWGETRIWMPLTGEGYIPIGRDGGNNQILISTSGNVGEIFKMSASTRKLRVIAKSLSNFIDMLRKNLNV